MRRSLYRKIPGILLLLLLGPLYAADTVNVIIPKPQKLTPLNGSFSIDAGTVYSSDTSLADNAIFYLQGHLKRSSGFTLKHTKKAAHIHFHLNTKRVKKAEGYHLRIDKRGLLVEARDRAGFFYGTISLMQLTDPAIWGRAGRRKSWKLPACDIRDYPRFQWRGMMLDSSRNFFSVTYVKKFIDRMAQQKLNRFHWHLTDDEGWRIQIRRYPLLTAIGAKRGPGTKLPFSTYPAMRGSKDSVQSGYYTQRQIREIVAYARRRSIEILPEIDIPGHSKAAVTAYPKLLLDPKDRSRYRSVQRVANNTIDPGLESSYRFLDGVLSEVSGLFPFGYIHLGGDEVPKGAWKGSPAVAKLMHGKGLHNKREVENYFFGRMERILARYGKKMAAWQEVTLGHPTLRRSSLIMAWKSPKAAAVIAKKGYPTVMAPVQYLYFDQQYVRNKTEPGHTWSTPISLKKSYSLHPLHTTRGVEACLWSETLLDEKIADYLAWPRTFALSEIAWTEERNRHWNDFKKRVYDKGVKRLKVQHIHYRPQ
jgi:hexosaminidase